MLRRSQWLWLWLLPRRLRLWPRLWLRLWSRLRLPLRLRRSRIFGHRGCNMHSDAIGAYPVQLRICEPTEVPIIRGQDDGNSPEEDLFLLW